MKANHERTNYGKNQNGKWMVWRECRDGIQDKMTFANYEDAMEYRDQLLDIFGV